MASAIGRRRFLAGILCPAAFLCPAFAQEAGNGPPPLDPAAHADWSGPYFGVGASAGGGYGRYRLQPFTAGCAAVPGVPSGFQGFGDRTSWQAGVFAGHLWQRGRLGWAFDDYLLYGTAGVAFARHRLKSAPPFTA